MILAQVAVPRSIAIRNTQRDNRSILLQHLSMVERKGRRMHKRTSSKNIMCSNLGMTTGSEGGCVA